MAGTGEPLTITTEQLTKETEKKRTTNAYWSEAEDVKLLKVLLEEQANGLQAESGWKKSVWNKVVLALHQEFPASKNKTADKARTRFDKVSPL